MLQLGNDSGNLKAGSILESRQTPTTERTV